jgi:hypothetical protein
MTKSGKSNLMMKVTGLQGNLALKDHLLVNIGISIKMVFINVYVVA